MRILISVVVSAFSAAVLSDLSGKNAWFRFGNVLPFISCLDLPAPIHALECVQRCGMSDPHTTGRIIQAAIKIHRKLGPGLLESAYEACLAYELEQVGLQVQRQKAVPLVYNTVKLECGFRADLVIEREVVVEIKCKEAIHPVDQAQLLSYLRLLDLRVGLLINFHVLMLKDGIKRMVNNYHDVAWDVTLDEESIYR